MLNRSGFSVVSLEAFGHDRQQILRTIEKLEKRARILAATVRLLLALRRASGFRLTGERLPEGTTKASILRAIASAEIAMPLRTLALYAQRIGKVFASPATWARLIGDLGWRRPRLRVHPAKPTVGICATSRKILAWTIGARLDPTRTCDVLVEASRHLDPTGARPTVMADSGVENVNAAVDATLLATRLHRVLAQVEVTESNSMIEAWWRSLKHQWLYLNSLDTIERVRTLVAFFVEEHNAQMPHAAFRGQTPDEMYFATAVNLPAELADARKNARELRLATNRGGSDSITDFDIL